VEPRDDGSPGPLSDRTLLVKDLVDVAGVRATYGSRIYAAHKPERTAPAAQRLLDAGAVLVGKANLPEFAWNVTGQNPWYGTSRTPCFPAGPPAAPRAETGPGSRPASATSASAPIRVARSGFPLPAAAPSA
jgi:Asp-tRNA(Asn)/Glu-tRNA(Gln) amidotransferase A subunit family amidase